MDHFVQRRGEGLFWCGHGVLSYLLSLFNELQQSIVVDEQ